MKPSKPPSTTDDISMGIQDVGTVSVARTAMGIPVSKPREMPDSHPFNGSRAYVMIMERVIQ